MTETYPLILAGEEIDTGEYITIQHPYDGHQVGRGAKASPEHMEHAIAEPRGIKPARLWLTSPFTGGRRFYLPPPICMEEEGEEFLLFARRGKEVTQYPGFYELAPSGGLGDRFARPDGTVDFAGQLLAELIEECRISADMVEELTPFAVVFDRRENVYDICFRLTLSARRKTPLPGFSLSSEYDEAIWVPIGEVEKFISKNKSSIVPTSKGIIRAYKSLHK